MKVHYWQRVVGYSLLLVVLTNLSTPLQAYHLILSADVMDHQTRVLLVDMDDDYDLDVVQSSDQGTNRLAWIEQIDPFTWEPHIIATVDSVDGMEVFGVSDLDSDGDQDLLVVREVDDVWEYASYEQQADTWIAHSIHPSVSARAPAPYVMFDYDSDGDDDFVFVDYSNDRDIYYMRNEGSHVWTPIFVQSNDLGLYENSEDIWHCLPGDYDGDGLIDLVIATGNGSSVSWYGCGIHLRYHDGSIVTVYQDTGADDYCTAKEVLDFNNDGLLDILFEERQNILDYTHLATQTTSGNFTTNVLCGLGTDVPFWREYATLDYNCDGHLDFFIDDIDHPDYIHGVLYYNQDLTFHYEVVGIPVEEVISIGDIDGDGAPDFTHSYGGLSWQENLIEVGYASLELIPVSGSIAPGGTVLYGATIFHAAPTPVTANISARARGQQGGQLPLFNASIPLIPSQSIDYNGLTLDVPAWTQPGQYLVTIKLHYQDTTVAGGQMVVTVTGEPSESRPDDWREDMATGAHGWE